MNQPRSEVEPEAITVPRSRELLRAIARIVQVAEKTTENAAFEAPIRHFWAVFQRECDALGLVGRWSPWSLLMVLERCLLADESLPAEVRVEFAAAVASVRQITEQVVFAHRAEQASLN